MHGKRPVQIASAMNGYTVDACEVCGECESGVNCRPGCVRLWPDAIKHQRLLEKCAKKRLLDPARGQKRQHSQNDDSDYQNQ